MRYAKYKPTGIAWLPEVPEEWEVRKLADVSLSLHTGLNPRKFFELNPDGATNFYVTIREMRDGEIVFTENTARINDEALKLCNNRSCLEAGDILFSGTGTIGESALLKETPKNWNIKEGIYSIKPKQDMVLPAMLYYVVSSHLFLSVARVKAVGTGVKSVPMRELLNVQFAKPPLPAQRAIVAYLDEKYGKVDRLVAAKEKEVALLKELKQSMIAEAVTHGVRPKRRLIPSGIPWLPEVPEGWEVKTLRQFLKMVSRKGFPEKQLLSVTREQGVVVRNVESKEENHNFIPEDLSNYKLVEVGDFAINKMKSWQGSYGVSEHEGIVSPAYYICKLSGVDRSYFSAAIRSRPYVSFFARFSKGIRVDQWDLSPIALKEIPFLLPPLAEQREIVAYIEARAAKIDAAVKGLEREVAVLKEYKQRLIADVVTGQRKVA